LAPDLYLIDKINSFGYNTLVNEKKPWESWSHDFKHQME